MKKLNSQSFFFFKKYFFLKKKKCILVENSLGQIFFKKSFFGSLLNSIITQLNFFLKSFVLGNTYILQILSPGTMVFNLFNLAVCNGTYIFLKKKVSFKGFFQVILPSGFFKKININSLITLGRNDNIFEKKLIFSSFWAKKKKIRVRGIAKNPVDHPNGGRSNTKQPLKTPWGLIAKKSK